VHGIAHEALRHRVLLSYEAEAEGVHADQVVTRLLDLVPLP
jgi:MoxR-like ATPase